jgi:hypothetical protein
MYFDQNLPGRVSKQLEADLQAQGFDKVGSTNHFLLSISFVCICSTHAFARFLFICLSYYCSWSLCHF